jgi:hypothetical protein
MACRFRFFRKTTKLRLTDSVEKFSRDGRSPSWRIERVGALLSLGIADVVLRGLEAVESVFDLPSEGMPADTLQLQAGI